MGSIPASPDAVHVPLLLCQERFNEASLPASAEQYTKCVQECTDKYTEYARLYILVVKHFLHKCILHHHWQESAYEYVTIC